MTGIVERLEDVIIRLQELLEQVRPPIDPYASTIELLKHLEGVCNHAYEDSAGHRTIGIGHKLTADELDTGVIRLGKAMLFWEQGLTLTQVEALLRQDLQARVAALAELYPKHDALSWHQRDALLSFIFNVGSGAFADSTLLKRLQSGDFDDVPNQLRLWVKSGRPKRIDPGLVNRRAKEICWWLTGSLDNWQAHKK